MSSNVIEALIQLIFKDCKLTLTYSTALIYLTDGGGLELPVVTKYALEGKAKNKTICSS